VPLQNAGCRPFEAPFEVQGKQGKQDAGGTKCVRAGLKTRHYNCRPEGRRYESKRPLPENGGHRANPPIGDWRSRARFPGVVLGGDGYKQGAPVKTTGVHKSHKKAQEGEGWGKLETRRQKLEKRPSYRAKNTKKQRGMPA
jgi:hypothetical protein